MSRSLLPSRPPARAHEAKAVSSGRLPVDLAIPTHATDEDFLDLLETVEAELFAHPIVRDNHYTRWFRRGEATYEDLRSFTVQFSVFSNQFLVAQLRKMINA